MNISDTEARILRLVSGMYSYLEGVGYENIKQNNPEKIVKSIQDRLIPIQLKAAMVENLHFRERLIKIQEYLHYTGTSRSDFYGKIKVKGLKRQGQIEERKTFAWSIWTKGNLRSKIAAFMLSCVMCYGMKAKICTKRS